MRGSAGLSETHGADWTLDTSSRIVDAVVKLIGQGTGPV